VYRTGHYGAALVAFAPVAYLLLSIGEPALAVVAGGGMLWLAMLPDVDHSLPLVRHRGPTHSFGFAALVGGAFAGVGLLLGSAMEFTTVAGIGLGVFGFLVGAAAVVAHLLADVITPAGAPLLWPVSGRRYSLGLARADNTVWNYGLFAAGVFAVAGVVVASFAGLA
jgi:inner membrane protein